MSRKILALAVAAVVLVPVLIVGLSAQVKTAPPAETPQAAADPFLDPTIGRDRPKPEKPPAAGEDPFANPAAEPAARRGQPKAAQHAPAVRSPKRRAGASTRNPSPLRSGEQAIRKALGEPTRLDLTAVPLNELVEQICQQHRIAMLVDKKALDDAGIAIDTPVTGVFSDISLRSALRLILSQPGLTWLFKDDVLLITTPEVADQSLVTKTYDVTDLLMPPADYQYRPQLPTAVGNRPVDTDGSPQGVSILGGGCVSPWIWNRHGPSANAPSRNYDYDSLIDLMTSVIRPATWDDAGGPGSIQRLHGTIVVSQTQEVHEEIEDLLVNLRGKAQSSPTILVELKWLWLDAKQHEQLVGGQQRAAGEKRSLTVDAKALDQLARTSPGFRGQIACGNGQWVHLASGDRRSVIVSTIPVMDRSVGYQPVVQVPNVGVVVELRPSVAPGATTALLDVQSTVTRWAKPQPPMVHVGGSWPPYSVREGDSPVFADTKTGTVPQPAPAGQAGQPAAPAPTRWTWPQEITREPGGSASSPVERPQMPAQQLATTLRVPLGKPMIVGAMTFAPDGDAGVDKAADNPRQLYLIATASVASE